MYTLLMAAIISGVIFLSFCGKRPRIRSAMRFGVKGIQKGLTSTNIYGIPLDPKRENVLQALVEKRQQIKNEMKKFLEGASEHKMLDAQQKALKILNSATGYGINVELHPENTHEWVKIYSDTEFKSFGAYEKPGTYFNPIIGACITAGARLLLGIAEKYVTDKGEMHAYMDTDSIFVPPYLANELVELFKSLNPYSFDRSILEIEDGMEDIWFYGISSKRYCLFRKRGNIIIIPEGKKRFYKLHGLGHLTDPFGRELIEDHRWEKEFWHDILRLHYDPTLEEEILEKYDDAAAISKLTVTTGNILTKFKVVNRRKPFRKRIKPFNFILVGYGTTVNVDGEIIKPIAPYHNNPQEAVEEKFVDYKSGKVLQGRHYWKTLGDVFWEYINHPESKYEGDVGILR